MKQPCRARSSRHAATILALIALFVLAAVPVAAGLQKGDGEIGFDFGVADLDTDYINDVGGGLTFRGGYFFTDAVELEGQLGAYGATNYYSSNTYLRTLMVNAVFNFRPDRAVMPYILIGTGLAQMDYDRWWDALPGPYADDNSIAVQAGAGSRFFFGKAKKVAVRVELTFLHEETFEKSATHERFMVGFTWRLGR